MIAEIAGFVYIITEIQGFNIQETSIGAFAGFRRTDDQENTAEYHHETSYQLIWVIQISQSRKPRRDKR